MWTASQASYMYIYIYIHIYTCTYTHAHTYIHTVWEYMYIFSKNLWWLKTGFINSKFTLKIKILPKWSLPFPFLHYFLIWYDSTLPEGFITVLEKMSKLGQVQSLSCKYSHQLWRYIFAESVTIQQVVH